MSNDHAQDRYDPPGVGSEFEQQVYGDVVKGEILEYHQTIHLRSIEK